MKKINVLLVLVLVVFAATLAGCKKTSAVEDKPVASETVSSEEVPEEVSEEPSSEVSEEISEEVSEEVVEIDLSKYSVNKGKKPVDLIKDMNYNELKIAVWGTNGAKTILSDGDSIVEEEDGYGYYLVFPKSAKEVKVNNAEIMTEEEKFYGMIPYSAEDAYDVTCEVTYEDGTTETITVNITVFK